MSFNFQADPTGASSAAGTGRDVFTVSRLNATVRSLLDRSLGLVWVEGELSNLAQPSSGHWYFTLKDRDAQLRCAMFRLRNASVGFAPKAGQHVLVRGRVGLYEARGDYQLIVEHMEDAGLGALRREFERLKQQLESEGLFALERKRPLPQIPRRIGIITSRSGAAIRDILHVLARRFPAAPVLIYPASVQGHEAVPTLVRALQTAGARAECDVLIIARGGGSLEDLWAFNDERLARVISDCPIPVVSGVGHEVDFTICDFVADVRAPTPSAAAELVVPDRRAYLETLVRHEQRLHALMQRELRATAARFDGMSLRLSLLHPGVQLQQHAQRLDELETRMAASMQRGLKAGLAHVASMELRFRLVHPGARLRQQQQRLAQLSQQLAASMRYQIEDRSGRIAELAAQLEQASPAHRLREHDLRQESLSARLNHAMQQNVARAAHRLALAQRALDAVSPLATLGRGYAIVTRTDGKVIIDSKQVEAGEEIEARLGKGRIRALVTGRQ